MKKFTFRTLLAFTILLGLAGCKVAVIVTSGGAVQSLSGTRNCTSGQVCEFDVTNVEFVESFKAVPAPGYEFVRWQEGDGFLCGGSESLSCIVNFPKLALFKEADAQAALSAEILYYVMPVFNFVGIDTDGDGEKDHLDEDDDNDGILDVDDPCPLEENPDCGVKEVSGYFYEDVYWRKSDGEIHVVGQVTILDDFNLFIEEGANVKTMGEFAIKVNGNLYVQGTAENPVELNNTAFEFIGSSPSVIDINFGKFGAPDDKAYAIWNEGDYPQERNITIQNSVFDGAKLFLISFGETHLIKTSSFINGATLNITGDGSVGLISQNRFEYSRINSKARALFENNLITGRYPSLWPVSTTSTATWTNNSILFDPSDGGTYAFSGSGNAKNNYWGTTDSRLIDLVILDGLDSGGEPPYVLYEPFLDAPHPDTPVAF